jgi:hypothetical protein
LVLRGCYASQEFLAAWPELAPEGFRCRLPSVPGRRHRRTPAPRARGRHAKNYAVPHKRPSPAPRARGRHPKGAGLSDRQIAEYVGVDHKTVAKCRAELEATGELPQSTIRTGLDGRTTDTSNIGGGAGKLTIYRPSVRHTSGSRRRWKSSAPGGAAHKRDIHSAWPSPRSAGASASTCLGMAGKVASGLRRCQRGKGCTWNRVLWRIRPLGSLSRRNWLRRIAPYAFRRSMPCFQVALESRPTALAVPASCRS